MAFLALFVLFVALIASGIWYFLRWYDDRTRAAYSKRKVKYVPQRNALLQVLNKERLEESTQKILEREGSVFGFNFLGSYTICVAEPEIAQLVLSKEFTNFTNRRLFDIDDPFFKNSVSVVQDEQWKRLRAVMTPTFSAGKLKRMKPLIDDTVRTLIKNFDQLQRKNSNVNIKQICGSFTMDTIIQVAFGTKVDSLVEKDNPIITKAKKVFSVDFSLTNIIKFTLVLMTPKLAKLFKIRINGDVTDFFDEFASKIIARKRQELAANKKNFKAQSFIELLLEAEVEDEEKEEKEKEQMQNGHSNGSVQMNGSVGQEIDENANQEQMSSIAPKKKYITHEELVAQCILFFLAGYDTTATTITMASYLLATNPDTQEKLHQEIVEVIEKLQTESGDNGTKDPVELVTLETLPRFEYLNGVISETLRLYSPATFTERTASKDIVLESEDGRCHIEMKKNDVIQFPIYAMHRNEQDFPEPEAFKPERFIGEPRHHKYSYLPFGSGPRNCIARSLALLEAKLALLHMIRVYKFSVGSETKVPPEFFYQSQLIVPKDIILKAEKR